MSDYIIPSREEPGSERLLLSLTEDGEALLTIDHNGERMSIVIGTTGLLHRANLLRERMRELKTKT